MSGERDPLYQKTVVLGVCGSIACYKAIELARRMTQAGALVDVIMTEGAQQFVTPLTFQTLTQRPVVTGMWTLLDDAREGHVDLAERADAIVIAPATATTIARLAHGFSDDMLSLTVLAARVPLLLAPAMHPDMWGAAATQENIATLKRRGATIIEPGIGQMAQQATGRGRLAETAEILGAVRQALGQNGDLNGRTIIVTAGGTEEPIDPVRFISNRSSGKMGFALAEAARDRGANVILIATRSTQGELPVGMRVVPVGTANEMNQAVQHETQRADVLIMAAAVADYRVEAPSEQKIKKQAASSSELTLRLVANPDILAGVQVPGVLKVGFAAESEELLKNAREKLHTKNLALIVANDITAPDSGFGRDTNTVTLIDREGKATTLPNMPKYDVAHAILDRVKELLACRQVPDQV